jgi:hypothetical protein
VANVETNHRITAVKAKVRIRRAAVHPLSRARPRGKKECPGDTGQASKKETAARPNSKPNAS